MSSRISLLNFFHPKTQKQNARTTHTRKRFGGTRQRPNERTTIWAMIAPKIKQTNIALAEFAASSSSFSSSSPFVPLSFLVVPSWLLAFILSLHTPFYFPVAPLFFLSRFLLATQGQTLYTRVGSAGVGGEERAGGVRRGGGLARGAGSGGAGRARARGKTGMESRGGDEGPGDGRGEDCERQARGRGEEAKDGRVLRMGGREIPPGSYQARTQEQGVGLSRPKPLGPYGARLPQLGVAHPNRMTNGCSCCSVCWLTSWPGYVGFVPG